MWDWLKFFPVESAWSKRSKSTEIRGPYFTKSHRNKWIFGDSAFYFKAPWANPVLGFGRDGYSVNAVKPGLVNILKGDWERVYGNSDAPSASFDMDSFYKNTWYFIGPWFSGMDTSLSVGAILVSASPGSLFNESSLYHPRVFEMVIANFLDSAYGYHRSGKRPAFRGPLNWRILPLSATIQAVVCDIHQIGNGSKDNPLLRRLVFFPVSDHQFVRVVFNLSGVEIYRDEVRAKPLLTLCDSIIDSMRMDVGESALAKWNKVKEECPDIVVVNHFRTRF